MRTALDGPEEDLEKRRRCIGCHEFGADHVHRTTAVAFLIVSATRTMQVDRPPFAALRNRAVVLGLPLPGEDFPAGTSLRGPFHFAPGCGVEPTLCSVSLSADAIRSWLRRQLLMANAATRAVTRIPDLIAYWSRETAGPLIQIRMGTMANAIQQQRSTRTDAVGLAGFAMETVFLGERSA